MKLAWALYNGDQIQRPLTMDPNHFGNNPNMWVQGGGYFPPMSPPFNGSSPPFNGVSPPFNGVSPPFNGPSPAFATHLSPGRSLGDYPPASSHPPHPGLMPPGFNHYTMRQPDASQGFGAFEEPMGFLQRPGEGYFHTLPPPPPLTSMAGFLQKDCVLTSTPVAPKMTVTQTGHQKLHSGTESVSAFLPFNLPTSHDNQVGVRGKQGENVVEQPVASGAATDEEGDRTDILEFNLPRDIPHSAHDQVTGKTNENQTETDAHRTNSDSFNSGRENKMEAVTLCEGEEKEIVRDQSKKVSCENSKVIPSLDSACEKNTLRQEELDNNFQGTNQDDVMATAECNNVNSDVAMVEGKIDKGNNGDEDEVCLLSPHSDKNEEEKDLSKSDENNSMEGSLGEEEEISLQPKSGMEGDDDIIGADVGDDSFSEAQTGEIEQGTENSGAGCNSDIDSKSMEDDTTDTVNQSMGDKDIERNALPDASENKNEDRECSNKDTENEGDKDDDDMEKNDQRVDESEMDTETNLENGEESPTLDKSSGVTVKSEPVDEFFDGNQTDGLMYKIKIEPDYVADNDEEDPGIEMESGPAKKERRSNKSMKVGPKSAKLRMPFEQGWKREVVIRNYEGGLTKDGKKISTLADTYYFTPDGRKLRSLVKVQEYLDMQGNTDLNLDCFSFIRKPIYKEPYEMVRTANRHAGRKSLTASPSFGSPTKEMLDMLNNATSTSWSDTRTTKHPRQKKKRGRPAAPKKLADIKIPEQDSKPEKIENVELTTEKEKSAGPAPKKIKLVFPVDEAEKSSPVGVSDSGTKKGASVVKSFVVGDKHRNHLVLKSPDQSLCSLNCPGLDGAPPSLQCGVCMCLFHPQCVNFIGSTREALFICLRCKDSVKKADVSLLKDTSPTQADALVMKPSNWTMKPSIWTKQKLEEFVKSKDQKQTKSEDDLELKITGVMSIVQNTPLESSQASGSTTPVSSSGAIRSILNQVPEVTPISLKTAPPPPPLVKAPTARLTREDSSPMGPPSILQAAPGAPRPNMIFTRLPVAPLPVISVSGPAPPVSMVPQPVPPMAFTRFAVPSSPCSSPGESPSHSPKIQVINQQDGSQKCQLLTLPMGVVKKINLSQPLAIKLNNQTYMIPPTCFVPTSKGIKIMLPSNTLPVTASTKVATVATTSSTSTVTNAGSSSDIQAAVSRAVSLQQKPFDESKGENGDNAENSDKNISMDNTKQPRRSVRIKTLDQSKMCHFRAFHMGFDSLMHVFQYLTTAELLRASRVCRTWRNIISQISFWTHVRLKDSCISDWEAAARHFKKFNTHTLDMRGLLHREDRNRTWHQMTAVLGELTSLRRIDFGRAPAIILQHVAERMPNLEVLTAEWITDTTTEPQMWSTNTKIDLGKFIQLANLQELRLRGLCGLVLPAFAFSGGLADFGKLKNLRILSLTTMKNVPDVEFAFIGQLENLEVLEIGDCTTWSAETYLLLSHLKQLHTLRLENGSENADSALAVSLKELTKLEQLELIMFVIGSHLAATLPQLTHIKTLSVWPNLTTPQAAVVNTNTLDAVSKLINLKTLDWGIMPDKNSSVILSDQQGENDQSSTAENKDASSSDNGEGSNRTPKKSIECIPFLPASTNHDSAESDVSMLPEYVSIDQLMDRLCAFLPKAQIRVFRVPVYSPPRIYRGV
ncbi:uncharacterized protein LOC106161834 isoform X2 [Lingula anatina]|uniref:Uncharacterized protein LOC106161834 isoform X2 n=1 Tax=Lingula anatina TaxID=7574 RepID=A0A1S3I7V3_LINAN|nr:uncharacterized protein LOC106161834 isoform X2 [Lingula anatina]|eukprot:XP_013394337.1 uncharacterized protein LOC106161834 isoform X2 [Lingula anatina]